MRAPSLAVLAAALLIASCAPRDVPSVDRENLFTLSIGRMEDQVDLFALEGRGLQRKTRLAMRDGIFYVSDGNGAKVSRFTSYGDLLSMIYNPETNPPPLTLREDAAEADAGTRRAIAYPLNQPGEIALDSKKRLYVEDKLPADRRTFDAENQALLDGVVLKFDGDGRFVEYLGREGVGGSPFPLIAGIQASVDDEVAVTCRLPSGWEVYWFDAEGNLLYLVRLRRDELPSREQLEGRPSLDGLVAAPDARKLYLKVDYYRDTVDESTETRSGIGQAGSAVWAMDVETGSFAGYADVPAYESSEMQNDRRVATERIYSFLGAAKGGKLFLFAPEKGGYALLLLQEGSKDQSRGFIRVDEEELRFNAFNLSADGILSALLASEFEAKAVWWRTDRFIGDPRQ